jgi:LAO/AO transport system kinase
MKDILERFLHGDRIACARMITLVEDNSALAEQDVSQIFAALKERMGRALRIGITGPPGAGKSSLADKLTLLWRKQGKTIGIVAVDPTSPFSGGAILGDRIRMTEIAMDPGVFIRSMATRGSLGGLARRTQEVSDLLDAFGKDILLIETVGVGQSELEIAGAADVTLVVLVPESGDSIQAMKAGLMEIGDLFVVNKADRPGADQAVSDIEMILKLKDKEVRTPILKTTATTGEGVEDLRVAIEKQVELLQATGGWEGRRERRVRERIAELVEDRIRGRLWERGKTRIAELAKGVMLGRESLFEAAERAYQELMEELKKP